MNLLENLNTDFDLAPKNGTKFLLVWKSEREPMAWVEVRIGFYNQKTQRFMYTTDWGTDWDVSAGTLVGWCCL